MNTIIVRLNNNNPIISTSTDNKKGYKCSTPEFHILHELYLGKGLAIDRDTLLEVGWSGRIVSPNSVPVAITNLRKILKDISGINLIYTKKGLGYGLETRQSNIQFDFITDNISPIPNTAPPQKNFNSKHIFSTLIISLSLFFIPFAITKTLTHKKPKINIYTNGINKLITKSEINNTIDNQAINLIIKSLNYQIIDSVDFYDIAKEFKKNKNTIIFNHTAELFSIYCVYNSHDNINTYATNSETAALDILKDGTICQN